ncbi:hypothetical protein D3C76_649640 [compost metagenome]
MMPGVPSMLPDSRTGALTPIAKESVREISNCEAGRAGPKIRTFANSPLGPTTATVSLAANCPG